MMTASQAGTDLFTPIESSSAVNAIHRAILELIETRQLVRGQRLPPERDLAKTLGVSRTTVRDALRSLEGYGVLQARQGASWFVVIDNPAHVRAMSQGFRLTNITLNQMVEARLALEPTIAEYAAQRRTPDELDALQDCYEHLAATADSAAYVDFDRQFHMLIAGCAHNQFLEVAMTRLVEVSHQSRHSANGHLPTRASVAEHRSILNAIARQDAAGARAAMRGHLNSFRQRTAAIYEAAS